MKYLIALLLVAVAACAAPATTDSEDNTMAHGMGEEGMTENSMHDTGMDASPDSEASSPDVTFQLTGQNFAFYQDGVSNPDLVVQEGDIVRIEFESTEGMHDWVVDAFDASTEVVTTSDGMTAVEFVADTAGTYEYYCSVGSHRANGMYGNLIVE